MLQYCSNAAIILRYLMFNNLKHRKLFSTVLCHFWYGSGELYQQLRDPDPTQDPALFVSGFQASFFYITFFKEKKS